MKMRRLVRTTVACVLWAILHGQSAWPASPQISVPLGAKPSSLHHLFRGQSATQLPDGRWLLLGGVDKNGPSTKAMIQDPRSGSVVTLKNGLAFPRAWHSATMLPDGRVLVLGGNDSADQVVTTAEIFDSESQTSRVIHVALLPRAHHTATILTDGRVLIAGGVGADGAPLDAVEALDPRSLEVLPLKAELSLHFQDHIASILADGSVLLWGGTDRQGQSLNYAELFDPDLQGFALTSAPLPTVVDHNVPVVMASMPADGASDVSPDTLIAVRFSKPLDVRTVNSKSLVLQGPSGFVPVKVVPAENGMIAFVSPRVALQTESTFTLRVQAARDSQDLLVVPKDITFTTAGTSGSNSGATSGGVSSDADHRTEVLPPLTAGPGVTAISGQVLQLNRMPLRNVTLQIGNRKTTTDETGRFLLQQTPHGHQVMVIDGRTASSHGVTYGLYEDGVEIEDKKTNVLSYKIWMTPLDLAHAVDIPSPTSSDTVVTTPLLPGLELHIPPKTTIYDHDGKKATRISITPIPVDRPPFPLPRGVDVPIYFTIQPGGAYLRVAGDGPKGARLFYPNSGHMVSGTRFSFWNYDADEKGWYVYGQGTVTADRRQVMPDPGVVIYEFTGAMVANPPGAPGKGPTPKRRPKGDPIDPATGLFLHEQQDSYLADVLPITLTRTYRQGDTFSHDFGMGTTHNYACYLIGDSFPYTYMELILPDGGRIHYNRISPGTGYADAVYQHMGTPSAFYGSTITWNPNILPSPGGWNLRLKTGIVLGFPDSYQTTLTNKAALLFVQDRFGNILNINRDSTTGNIVQITSPNGRWLQFTYDSNKRITQITDNIGRSTTYAYDANGRLHTVTDPNQGITTYAYDPVNLDQLVSITDPRQITYLQNHYDSSDRVDRQTLANGGTYLFNYTTDGSGNITQTDVTDPNGYVNRITFSAPTLFANGFLTGGYTTSEMFAVGRPEQQAFTYDLGLPTTNPGYFPLSLTDPLGRVTNNTYDSMGNVSSITRLAGSANAATTLITREPIYNRISSITDPLGHQTTIVYDESTNQTAVTDPLGHQSKLGRNSLGQITSLVDPLTNSWIFSYAGGDLTTSTDPLNNTTQFLYDGAGRLITLTAPLGATTEYKYDNLNNLLSMTDARGGVTNYGYDVDNNLTSVADPQNGATPNVFGYDSLDRLSTRTDSLGHFETYSYDLNGNLVCTVDRKGQATVLAYDGIGRRTAAIYNASSCAATSSSNQVTYSYDGGNRLTTAADAVTGTINQQYDGLDDLVSESTSQGTINYNYDVAGRRISTTVAGQASLCYSYDAADRVTGIGQGTCPGATTAVSIAYDNADRRSSITLPNGLSAQYSYDTASRVTAISYVKGIQTIGNLTYSYDANGRQVQEGGSLAQVDISPATGPNSYNAGNQLANWGSATLSYDLNGNLQNDGLNTYAWDARNHLSTISGGTTASFQYDAFGRRSAKNIGGANTSYLYDGNNVAQELSGVTPTASLLTGLATDEFFARTDLSGTYSFLTDALGSPLALADSTGTVQTRYTYEPFGNTSMSGSSNSNTFQYTARENDGTGLYYYRARYYSPFFGRFISEDPLGLASGFVDLYAYSGDDPIDYVDPWGTNKRRPPLNQPPPNWDWEKKGIPPGCYGGPLLGYFCEPAAPRKPPKPPLSPKCKEALGQLGMGLAGTAATGGAIVASVYLGPEMFEGLEVFMTMSHLGPIGAPGLVLTAQGAAGAWANCR